MLHQHRDTIGCVVSIFTIERIGEKETDQQNVPHTIDSANFVKDSRPFVWVKCSLILLKVLRSKNTDLFLGPEADGPDG